MKNMRRKIVERKKVLLCIKKFLAKKSISLEPFSTLTHTHTMLSYNRIYDGFCHKILKTLQHIKSINPTNFSFISQLTSYPDILTSPSQFALNIVHPQSRYSDIFVSFRFIAKLLFEISDSFSKRIFSVIPSRYAIRCILLKARIFFCHRSFLAQQLIMHEYIMFTMLMLPIRTKK